jgi:sensor histidine kinase regulating citrate/malate metabolism
MKTENKIYWLILSSLLALCFSILVPTFFMVRYELMELIRDRLIANATAAALAYDGDILESISVKNQAERTQEIQKIQKINTRLENIHPDIKFAYIMTKDEEGTIAFLVDSITIDRNSDGVISENEKSAEMGEIYKNPTSQMKEGFLHPSADKEINSDRWGAFLSGYAPIYNSKNQPVAMVGLDMQASTVQNKMYIFYLTSIFAVAITILLSLFLSAWLKKSLLKLTSKD